MTTYYVNGIKRTKEELKKIEIRSEDLKQILSNGLGGDSVERNHIRMSKTS